MAKKSPLQLVKELHGGKEKLVDKLTNLLERGEESKEDFRQRLLGAANSKLIRLHDVVSHIQSQFGSKEKLVDTILGVMNRTKDKDYRDKLTTLSYTRLFDMYRSRSKKSAKVA